MRPKRLFTRKPDKPSAGPPRQYGKPFVLVQDRENNTFEFAGGTWIPYGLTIAQCRRNCLVTELPQKLNGNSRFEIRSPIPTKLLGA
jgi:hypothetical protein